MRFRLRAIGIAILVVVLTAVSCFNGKKAKIQSVEAWVNLMPTFDTLSARKGHILISFDLSNAPEDMLNKVRLRGVSFIINGTEVKDSLARWEITSSNELHIYNLQLQPNDTVEVVIDYEFDGKNGRIVTPEAVVKAVY